MNGEREWLVSKQPCSEASNGSHPRRLASRVRALAALTPPSRFIIATPQTHPQTADCHVIWANPIRGKRNRSMTKPNTIANAGILLKLRQTRICSSRRVCATQEAPKPSERAKATMAVLTCHTQNPGSQLATSS